ncbi:fatty acid desaturase family protein [Zavarzinella formosa]|uniref:fatty acid desaturase family protein n=1 Tax=Zavarzinella formosa TaxID=360055 RepID=UPI0002EBF2E6|nr:fatty acid desaturase [Zavarzinella formosa]
MPDETSRPAASVPPLRLLGADLLHVSLLRRLFSLMVPFACAGAYFVFAINDWWPAAVLSLMALSFFTYSSTSHDLVHRSLGMPGRMNEVMLCVIELLALRSGHAYRAIHLNHHARFPEPDDIEGAAARMSWLGAIRDGLTLQYRAWWWAVRRGGRDRAWMIGEALACLSLVIASALLAPVTPVFLIYAALMIAGSWLIPLATSYIPHDPDGHDELTQTRAYRGLIASAIAFRHLYHLEHHLYPAVPHQNWPKLAKRLDPYLHEAGVVARRFWV